MKATLTKFLGTLALSCGLSAAAWAQQPLPGPPGPTPLPPPTLAGDPKNLDNAPPPAAAPGGIIISPGANPGGTCAPIVSGGCIDACMPRAWLNGTWIVGGGVYYMAPVYNNNHAFTTTSSTTTGATTTVASNTTNFSTKLQIAPLAFVGYTFDNGLGVRFRWFQIRQDQSAGATLDGTTGVTDALGTTATVLPAGKGTSIVADSHLYLSAYDLEATYTTTICNWFLIGSFGARYAQINQGYSLVANDPTTPTSFISSSNHNFNGFGPTMSLEAHRCLCDWGFGVYASARGSILFGSGNLSNSTFAVGGGDPLAVTGSGSQTSVIPVGEMEAGGEWNYCCGRLHFFAQIGVVGQVWWGVGNAATPLATSNGSPSNLGFIGGVARAGITF